MLSLLYSPSPLGPGHMGEQLHMTGDGGVPLSSAPDGAAALNNKTEDRRLEENGRQMKGLNQRTRVPSSPTVQRYVSTGSVHTPVFDFYPRNAQIDNEGNISLPPPGLTNSSGHSRKHTDPFLDHDSTQHGSQYGTARMSGPPTHFQLQSQSSMCLAPASVSATWPSSAPPTYGFSHQLTSALAPPASATFGLAVPPALACPTSESVPVPRGRPCTRSSHAFLPPPLSSTQGRYQHTPEARARLEAQKPTREEWIRVEAAKIAQLARLRYAAEHRYGETHAEQDYSIWQKVEIAFADATNLGKRQEERRNLFLKEKGMTALKTDDAKDMAAAYRHQGAKDRGEKLLGFNMALMERECAEVKRDGDEEAITAEMLATLSLNEKRALRKHLLGRLDRA